MEYHCVAAVLIILLGIFGLSDEIAPSSEECSSMINSTVFATNSSFSTYYNLTSPNYPNEYGEAVNCSWGINMTRSCVKIVFKVKDVHFRDPYGRNYCSGSYNIAIDGVQLDCLPTFEESPEDSSNCYFFHDSASQNVTSDCKNTSGLNDTLHITYQSDGRRLGDQNLKGFWMEIKVSECGSLSGDGTHSSDTLTHHASTTQESTQRHGNEDGKVSATTYSLGAIVGVLSLALIGIVIYVVWQRRKTKSTEACATKQSSLRSGVYDNYAPSPQVQHFPVYDIPPDAIQSESIYDSEI